MKDCPDGIASLITLQPAQPEDEAFLFDLYASTRRAELDAWGWDEAMQASFLRMQFTAQHASYRDRFPRADHAIVFYAKRPVGRLLVDRTDEAIMLVDVALLPEHRGGRVGTCLLRKLLDEAAEKKVPVRLQVLLDNPARRLYRCLGFTSLGHDGVYEQMEWRGPV
ncbi:MAG: GNAT family N-acetyltransferase [Rhodothermales bacterium]